MPTRTLPFCPKCKSVEVERDTSSKNIFVNPNFICKNCGYEGKSFPEVDVKELGIESKKESKLFWITWKIIGPLLIFLGIFLFQTNPVWSSFLLILGGFMCYTSFIKKPEK